MGMYVFIELIPTTLIHCFYSTLIFKETHKFHDLHNFGIS